MVKFLGRISRCGGRGGQKRGNSTLFWAFKASLLLCARWHADWLFQGVEKDGMAPRVVCLAGARVERGGAASVVGTMARQSQHIGGSFQCNKLRGVSINIKYNSGDMPVANPKPTIQTPFSSAANHNSQMKTPCKQQHTSSSAPCSAASAAPSCAPYAAGSASSARRRSRSRTPRPRSKRTRYT